jgi:hydrogenase maturation protein HypF
MACAWLSAVYEREPDLPASLSGDVDPHAWKQVRRLISTGTAAVATSSMGRLFDAVAALAGVRAEVNYEGQAAIELEAACDPGERGTYPISLSQEGELLMIDPREAIGRVAADVRAGESRGAIARRFHRAVASATVEACVMLAGAHETELVVLSGGVFQNRLLLESVADGLARAGLRVLVPERLPVNDGGIAYGQAAVAAAQL